jgi:hypothetical protein
VLRVPEDLVLRVPEDADSILVHITRAPV